MLKIVDLKSPTYQWTVSESLKNIRTIWRKNVYKFLFNEKDKLF